MSRSRTRRSAGSSPWNRRTLGFERLEDRRLLSIDSFFSFPLAETPIRDNTGEKPQSKLWTHNDQWWTVIADDTGTWIRRLDGRDWTPVLQLTSELAKADVKPVDDVAHILLYEGKQSHLASVEYVPGDPGTYQFWSDRPMLAELTFGSFSETATIDVDSAGRMWETNEASTAIEVRYSDSPYDTWSDPIVLASGVLGDDISVVTALADDSIGVLWSNQVTQRYGFRVHRDTDPPELWSVDEVPASQSAIDIDNGMADDHLNVAVASDGTLYAAVKTGYDAPEIAMLVRRPSGIWDDLHAVDESEGTRPIVLLNELQGFLMVVYRDDSQSIVYRESALPTIEFGEKQTLIPGTDVNDVSSMKANFTDELVVIASEGAILKSVFMSTVLPPNLTPLVNAGLDQTIFEVQSALLDGSVNDDGQPVPANLITTWTVESAPAAASVSFGDAAAIDTTASFNTTGQYVLRLTANDGEAAAFDEVVVTVEETPPYTIQSFQNGLDGYDGTDDTRLRVDQPDRVFGATSKLEIDGNPDFSSLIRWDLSSIPTESTVMAASITIQVFNTSNDEFSFYEVKRPWVEAEATFNLAAAGAAWEIAGAAGPSDRDTVALGTVTGPITGPSTAQFNDAGLAVVQSWISNPAINHGLAFQDYDNAVTDDLDFSSSEDDSVSYRPMLTVGYFLNSENQPPVLAPIGDKTVDEGSLLTFAISATDPETAPLTYSAAGLPAGAVFDSTSRAFSWTPSENQDGTHDVTFSVSDGLATVSETITITVAEVNQPPVLGPIGDKSIDEGSLLTFPVPATDADIVGGAPAVLTYSADGLPAGAALDPASGIFSWTPSESQDGTHSMTFHVSDGLATVSETIAITVAEVNNAPVLTAIGNKSVDESSLLSFTVSAIDPELDPLSYSASGLPVGAVFDPVSRTFSWTPLENQDGTHDVTFSVNDGVSTVLETITIAVGEINEAPLLTPIGDQSVAEGGLLSFTVLATDADLVGGLPNTLSYSAAGLPSGASLDLASGLFSWTPLVGQVGTYDVTFHVSDGLLTVSETITITVNSTPSQVTHFFQDGVSGSSTYAGTRDTRIKALFPDRNYGTNAEMQLDGTPDRGVLLKWDISSIAPGDPVASASFNLNVTDGSPGTYEVYETRQDWAEGEATWNEMTQGAAWESAGAQGASDRGSTVLGILNTSSTGLATVEFSAAGIAVVQSWIDDPASNHGLTIQDYDVDNGLKFDSRESLTPSNRPRLDVTVGDSGPPRNQAPTVSAGPDRTIVLPSAATLDGTVSDDGLPDSPGTVTTTWSVVSGPGAVTFADASAIDTTATFGATGTYVLRLQADDGELGSSDEVTIVVLEENSATTLSFQDGVSDNGTYAGTRDTRIKELYPDKNYGTNSQMQLDGTPDRGVLLKWDLSAIAPGTQVESVSLTLNVTDFSPDTYEIYQVQRDWTENEATWSEASSGDSWEIAGARGTSDVGSTVLGVVTASTTGLVTIELNAAGIAVVQSWIDDPSSNYGFLIQDYDGADNGLKFDSRESSTPTLRPRLDVTIG